MSNPRGKVTRHVPIWALPLQALGVSILVLAVTFLIVHLIPGDPAREILGDDAPQQAVDALRVRLHLNDPLFVQMRDFMIGALRGDFGESYHYPGTSVTSLILAGLRVTAVLVLSCLVLSVVVGVCLGLLAATTGGIFDGLVRLGSAVLLGVPSFFLGILAIWIVAVQLSIAPAGGWGEGYPGNLKFIWLPTIILSMHLAPLIARTVRQKARATMQESFIHAATSRGLSRNRIVFRHVLPNSALPTITLLGMQIGGLVGGAVVVESVFGLPGFGTVILNAAASRDYPVVQGCAAVAGVLVVFGNLLADLTYRAVDPRLWNGDAE